MSTVQLIARYCSSLQPLWAGRDGGLTHGHISAPERQSLSHS